MARENGRDIAPSNSFRSAYASTLEGITVHLVVNCFEKRPIIRDNQQVRRSTEAIVNTIIERHSVG